MSSATRTQRTYDHRLRDLVRSTGDIHQVTGRGVPRSTARGWLASSRSEVVTIDGVDRDVVKLQKELLALRKPCGQKNSAEARLPRNQGLRRVGVRNLDRATLSLQRGQSALGAEESRR